MNRLGFSLTELLVSAAILSVLSVLTYIAMSSTTTTVNVARSSVDVQIALRDVLTAISNELQLAAKVADDSLDPPLEAVKVNANPTPTSPTEIVFQVPTDLSGRIWSSPIRFRFVNEDRNGNARLDPGEDVNGDGLLNRQILRIQDLNGDGDTSDPGEERVIGGTNNISDVQFVVNGSVIEVTLTASELISGRQDTPVTATVTGRIYLLN